MAGKIARMVAYIAWQNHQKPFGFLPAPYCQLARKCIFKIIHYVACFVFFCLQSLYYKPMLRHLTRFTVLLPVHFYRLILSPIIPPRCRFMPSCSAYALEAVARHGAWAGFWLSAKRLARCHPIDALGGAHGYDPVPLEICCIAWYAPWSITEKTDETDK